MNSVLLDEKLTQALAEVAGKISPGKTTAHLTAISEGSKILIGQAQAELKDLLVEVGDELGLAKKGLRLSMGRKVVHGSLCKPHVWGAFVPEQIKAASHTTPQLYFFRNNRSLSWGISPSDRAVESEPFMQVYRSAFKGQEKLVERLFSLGLRGRDGHHESSGKEISKVDTFFSSRAHILDRSFSTSSSLPEFAALKKQLIEDFKQLLPLYVQLVDACRNAGVLDNTRAANFKRDWVGEWEAHWNGADSVAQDKVPEYLAEEIPQWKSMSHLWEIGKREAVYALLVSKRTDPRFQDRINALLFGALRRTRFTGTWRSAAQAKLPELAAAMQEWIARHPNGCTQEQYMQLIGRLKEISGFELHSMATRFLCDIAPNVYLPISRTFTVEALKKVAALLGLKIPNVGLNDYGSICEVAKKIAANFPNLPSDEKLYVLDHFLYWYTQVFSAAGSLDGSAWSEEDGDVESESHRFWKISCGRAGKYAGEHRGASLVSIGWSEVGDLSQFQSKEELRSEYDKLGDRGYDAGYATDQAWMIAKEMQPGDYVFGYGSGSILLVGRVSGPYEYRDVGQWATDQELVNPEHRNVRHVSWLNVDPIETSILSQQLKKKLERNQTILPLTAAEGEEVLAAFSGEDRAGVVVDDGREHLKTSLAEVAKRTGKSPEFLRKLESRLLKKQQVILFGPPGTSKTHFAKAFADYFLQGAGEYQHVQFHPSYSYEDFVEGYRPSEGKATSPFEKRSGVFKDFCTKARARQNERFFFVIDEINRGNLPQIFGELFSLLEYRDDEVTLPYSKSPFSIPSNVYIVGTMNTADRSIALVDFALRRRFEFFDFGPDREALAAYLKANGCRESIGNVLTLFKRLNDRVEQELGKHYLVGHTFFMKPNLDYGEIEEIWQFSIIPLLEEYFFENRDAVKEFDLASMWQSIKQAA